MREVSSALAVPVAQGAPALFLGASAARPRCLARLALSSCARRIRPSVHAYSQCGLYESLEQPTGIQKWERTCTVRNHATLNSKEDAISLGGQENN